MKTISLLTAIMFFCVSVGGNFVFAQDKDTPAVTKGSESNIVPEEYRGWKSDYNRTLKKKNILGLFTLGFFGVSVYGFSYEKNGLGKEKSEPYRIAGLCGSVLMLVVSAGTNKKFRRLKKQGKEKGFLEYYRKEKKGLVPKI